MIIRCESITDKAIEILLENGFVIDYSPNTGHIDRKDAESIIMFQKMLK